MAESCYRPGGRVSDFPGRPAGRFQQQDCALGVLQHRGAHLLGIDAKVGHEHVQPLPELVVIAHRSAPERWAAWTAAAMFGTSSRAQIAARTTRTVFSAI